MEKCKLKLIVMDNAKELGIKIDEKLKYYFSTNDSFIVNTENIRFSNGEGKSIINDTIRNKDVYILCDVGNYNLTYEMFGRTSFMGPDEHFQDLKRIIGATLGHSSSISVIMPLLYESRQHKRKGRESLDCAMALQELENLGVTEIITFDAHDVNVQNAIPCSSFDNFYPTAEIIEKMFDNGHVVFDKPDDYLVISPDMGAMDRAKFYAGILGSNVGLCYKRRDYTKIVNGKNPIVSHEYLGPDVNEKNIIIVDDMIASGSSMLECVDFMKKRGANKVFLVSTFALFTEGIETFNKYYDNGLITGVYSTNLTYLSNCIRNASWFYEVDCAEKISEIIFKLYKGESISSLLNGKENTMQRIRKLKRDFK